MGVGYYGEQNVSLRTERMIVLRERARLTQVGLAVRIGITQEAISGYESGKFQPSLKKSCGNCYRSWNDDGLSAWIE